MSPALLLLLASAVQDPITGAVGTATWPPPQLPELRYVANFEKRRRTSPETRERQREAAELLETKPPTKDPKQSVRMRVELAVASTDGPVRMRATSSLLAHELRLKFAPPAEGEEVAAFANDRLAELWGEEAAKAKPLVVPKEAFERSFETSYPRRRIGVGYEELGAKFGDHLLPVRWNHPLPCWAEEAFATLDLQNEAVVDGKSLIKDHTAQTPLGYRQVRIEARFENASTQAFTLRYHLDVEQLVNRSRDLAEVESEQWSWLFTIEGTARYSLGEQAFEKIEEQVSARLGKAPPAKLLAFHDEEFEGRITIERAATAAEPEDTGRRRRRR